MKFSSCSVAMLSGLLAPVWMSSSAFAQDQYVDVEVPENAKVTLSNNVNWTPGMEAQSLVDSDISPTKTVGYESDTCNVPIEDVGYVTIDLGSSQPLDGVRVYLNYFEGLEGAGRQYCNLFVNAWDEGTEAPTKPFEFPATSTVAPTLKPTSPPTATSTDDGAAGADTSSVDDGAAGAAAGGKGASGKGRDDDDDDATVVDPYGDDSLPTAAPTLKPTPVPTETPTASPVAAPISAQASADFAVNGQGHQNPLGQDPNNPLKCAQCVGPPELCDQLFEVSPCQHPWTKDNIGGEQYCANFLKNFESGAREISRTCINHETCYREWFQGSSDNDKCQKFDETNIVTLAFTCTYCCTVSGCNSDLYPKIETLYKDVRRNLANQESNVFSSGSNHEYGPVVSPQGLDIIFDNTRSIRYIRVWAGHNSVDNQVQLLQIAPLARIEEFAEEASDLEYNADFDDGSVTGLGSDGSVTDVETGSVTVSLTGSSSGDPHFKTWSGNKYDFHGGCSLVLLQNNGFANGLGLNIHIRTKISTWWSSIETAAVQIGPDTLEVTGGENGGMHWINKESFEEIQDGAFFTLAGFHVQFHQVTSKQKKYRVELGNGDAISIETYKDFVRVNVKAKNKEQFHGSLGLMGEYPSGLKVGRDGSTIVEDANDLGAEWQVLASEPMLFHSVVGPQHPSACAMPDTSETAFKKKKRRLGESLISEEDATLACARVAEDDRDACIFDVLATNDKGMAGSY